jgi:nucleotide-binding universal stress UspA family protein
MPDGVAHGGFRNAVGRARNAQAKTAGGSLMDEIEWKRICCPIDFSQPSQDAARVAARLSHRFGSELQLLHVFQLPLYSFMDAAVSMPIPMVNELLERVDSFLAHWAKEAEHLGAPKVVSTKVDGLPHVEIVKFARETHCDLIVMGTHGHTGVRHALIGSVAEKVIRLADCPVLTIRPRPAKQ